MLRAPEPVLMLIADITGYTTYLVGTEIDHAQNVLEDLLETVVNKLAPPLTIIKGEGDAVFLFAPGGSVSGEVLLDAIDATYFAFRRRLRDVTQATSCECNACVLIPSLDLKFIVHAGQAVRQTQFGHIDLVGPDVITIHRLLKNHIVEKHGWRGYAFISDQAVTALGLNCLRLGMVAHREEYEDAGVVIGFVEDLGERWTQERERSTFRLNPGDSRWTHETELPVEPHVAWEWLTSPRLRPRWMRGVQRVDQENPDGRAGVGTTNHCVHGKDAVLENVLDYRPFDTLTLESVTPLGPLINTDELVPSPTGTHLTVYTGSRAPVPPEVWAEHVVPILENFFAGGLNDLAQILAREVASPAESSEEAVAAEV